VTLAEALARVVTVRFAGSGDALLLFRPLFETTKKGAYLHEAMRRY